MISIPVVKNNWFYGKKNNPGRRIFQPFNDFFSEILLKKVAH